MQMEYDQLLKVMFVDDEEKTRKLLKVFIDWRTIGYEPVEDAVSANQAMELIRENRPDVVITDIEMPYIDGLEFAQMLSEEYPQIVVVVLTAHDVFQYAQKSIELGIKSFLLKPIRRNELIEVMVDVRKSIVEERKALYEFEGLKKRISESRELITQNFLNNLLLNKVEQENLWETIRYYEIPLVQEADYYNILVIMPEKHSDPEEDELRRQQCEEILVTAIDRLNDVLLLKDIHQNLIILSQNKKINLMSYATHFSVLIKEKLSLNVYAGCGSPVKSLEEIRYSYKQAYKNATIASYSHNKAFLASGHNEDKGDLQELIQNLSEEMPLYLGIPARDKVMQLADMAYGMLRNLQDAGIPDYLVVSYSIVNVMLSTLSDNGIPYIEIYSTEHLPYEKILRLNEVGEIENYVRQFMEFTVCQIEEYMDKKNSMLVHKIVQYMNEHMDDSALSLAKISKINYINYSYLSRTFKAVMGINFMDYLVSIRVEAAKKLLSSTNLKIYEVARNVGIEDPNYFSKFFKKHTQDTPVQYREKFQKVT